MNQNHAGKRDTYFKGQQENEELICFFRHHWIALIKVFSYFTILLIIIITSLIYMKDIQAFLRGNLEFKVFFATGFLAFNFFMHKNFVNLLNHFVDVGIITNMRIIDHQKSIFFKDTIDAIDMSQIQNIEQISNGILPNLLGYGDIKIYLTASSSVKTFHRMPNVKFHFRCLGRAKEQRQEELKNLEREHKDLDYKPPFVINEKVLNS